MLLDARGTMGDILVVTHEAYVARWARQVAQAEGPGARTSSCVPG